ncbi:hypothetical protein CRG98_020322 [Punica granatum]|uniref:Uncharacterized protein n=1 Tax=Punica granatum TaxID=22663 RepID=A0A2I0JSJ8_PUNGR|nr:hypothetical protein CRG98_020322 [Punica granatum]
MQKARLGARELARVTIVDGVASRGKNRNVKQRDGCEERAQMFTRCEALGGKLRGRRQHVGSRVPDESGSCEGSDFEGANHPVDEVAKIEKRFRVLWGGGAPVARYPWNDVDSYLRRLAALDTQAWSLHALLQQEIPNLSRSVPTLATTFIVDPASSWIPPTRADSNTTCHRHKI